MEKKYKVVITKTALKDISDKKKYILQQFKYRAYADNYSSKVRKAIAMLDTLPSGYAETGFVYRGYDIFLKPIDNELIFYTINEKKLTVSVLRVLQDGMDWQRIISEWIKLHH